MAHCTCTASWNVTGGSLDLSSVLSYAWKESDESESSEDCSKDEDLDGTSPPQPLILQPPDLDTPTSCEIHISCREHTNAEIVGLAVVSSAHHIEIFTKDGYQATGRGEVVCKPGNGSSCQQTMYHADLDLTYPVTDLSIRFVTLADRSCLVVYIIDVVLSPCKLSVPGRVDHRKVHQMLGESGVELSDGAKNLMRLVESQQQSQGNAMGQQTSNMAALLPLLGMFTGAMGGQPTPPPSKHPGQTTSQVPPASSSRTPVSSNADMPGGDFSNMLQNLTLSDQAGASGLNGDLMLSVLQNVCKDVGQNRQTSTGAEGRQVLTQEKETSRVDDMDVGERETSCEEEQEKHQVEEEINDNPRFVTDHEMSDMENRIMGNLSSMEERIMGRVDDQLQGMQNRIESKLDAVLNAVLSKKDDS